MTITTKHNASLNSSDARAVALLHDYNSILHLAQHVADTIHNQDAMEAAVSAYSMVSDRVGYTGKRLQIVCKSREEMTAALSSLMAHMEIAKEAEAAFRSNTTADYNKYMEVLKTQRTAQEKAISVHDAHLIEAQTMRSFSCCGATAMELLLLYMQINWTC